MPKLSQQAKENLAWAAGGLLLLLLIARVRKASAEQSNQVQAPQNNTTTLPAAPIQETPAPVADTPVQQEPLFTKSPIIAEQLQQQQQPQEEKPQLDYQLPSKITYKPDVVIDNTKEYYPSYGGSYGSEGYNGFEQYM